MYNILLLRAPSQESPDKYEKAFYDRGYKPSSIPVLETGAVNVLQLQTAISHGPAKGGFEAVVITSARSVEVWQEAIEALLQDDVETSDTGIYVDSGPRINSTLNTYTDWTSLPFYVVGEATATALAELAQQHSDSRYVPHNVLGGAESGTAEKLAHYILKHHPLEENPHPTFLYLTGDKNRDTLPSILTAGGISLRPLQVYETRGSSTLAQDLDEMLSNRPPGNRLPMSNIQFALMSTA